MQFIVFQYFNFILIIFPQLFFNIIILCSHCLFNFTHMFIIFSYITIVSCVTQITEFTFLLSELDGRVVPSAKFRVQCFKLLYKNIFISPSLLAGNSRLTIIFSPLNKEMTPLLFGFYSWWKICFYNLCHFEIYLSSLLAFKFFSLSFMFRNFSKMVLGMDLFLFCMTYCAF